MIIINYRSFILIILYILLALLVLLMMVTIHEFGHYVAGKLLGFKINEFSIGFGPSLYTKKKKNGEIFSIRLIPLGGYCAFEGEENNSENSGAFMKQKPWKRLIVLFNGAFFNFISAIIFSFIMLVSVGYDIPQVYTVDPVARVDAMYYVNGSGYEIGDFEFAENDKIIKINGVEYENLTKANLCAYLSTNQSGNKIGTNKYQYTISIDRNGEELNPVFTVTKQINDTVSESGLLKNDVIIKVDGVDIDFISDNYFNALVASASETKTSTTLTVLRNGEKKDIVVNFYDIGFKNENGEYAKAIGVKSQAYVFSVGEALVRSVPYTFGFSWKVLGALGQLITGKAGINDVGGPIYTIGTIANLSRQSISYFLTLLPLIAANLAIFNWLPIPALDGSKMVFTTIEWIRKKPLFSQKTENLIHNIGFFLLLALVFAADFYHIFVGIFT